MNKLDILSTAPHVNIFEHSLPSTGLTDATQWLNPHIQTYTRTMGWDELLLLCEMSDCCSYLNSFCVSVLRTRISRISRLLWLQHRCAWPLRDLRPRRSQQQQRRTQWVFSLLTMIYLCGNNNTDAPRLFLFCFLIHLLTKCPSFCFSSTYYYFTTEWIHHWNFAWWVIEKKNVVQYIKFLEGRTERH